MKCSNIYLNIKMRRYVWCLFVIGRNKRAHVSYDTKPPVVRRGRGFVQMASLPIWASVCRVITRTGLVRARRRAAQPDGERECDNIGRDWRKINTKGSLNFVVKLQRCIRINDEWWHAVRRGEWDRKKSTIKTVILARSVVLYIHVHNPKWT